jgi:hypothetical protein
MINSIVCLANRAFSIFVSQKKVEPLKSGPRKLHVQAFSFCSETHGLRSAGIPLHEKEFGAYCRVEGCESPTAFCTALHFTSRAGKGSIMAFVCED